VLVASQLLSPDLCTSVTVTNTNLANEWNTSMQIARLFTTFTGLVEATDFRTGPGGYV